MLSTAISSIRRLGRLFYIYCINNLNTDDKDIIRIACPKTAEFHVGSQYGIVYAHLFFLQSLKISTLYGSFFLRMFKFQKILINFKLFTYRIDLD